MAKVEKVNIADT